MNEKIKIRKGTAKDFPKLLSLIQEEAKFEKSPDSVKNSISQMNKEKKYIHFLIAEINKETVGIAVYSFVYYTWSGKSLYLDSLYIKEEHRNKGLGKMLLNEIILTAKKEECSRLRFEVEEKNKKAQKFYIKNGAKMGDRWFNCDFDKEEINRLSKTSLGN